MSCWKVLGIEKTKDLKEIKKAYAVKLKITRPEDDASAYQILRDAYNQAVIFAKDKDNSRTSFRTQLLIEQLLSQEQNKNKKTTSETKPVQNQTNQQKPVSPQKPVTISEQKPFTINQHNEPVHIPENQNRPNPDKPIDLQRILELSSAIGSSNVISEAELFGTFSSFDARTLINFDYFPDGTRRYTLDEFLKFNEMFNDLVSRGNE